MHKLLLALVILTASNAYASTLTYRIVDYPADQSGFVQLADPHYSYIVTDGTIGALNPSDVVGGGWFYHNPNATTGLGGLGSTISNTTTFFADLIATPTQLLLSSGGSLSFDNGGFEVLDYNNSSGTPSFVCYSGSPLQYAWNASNPTMNGNEPWVVAVIVPEPSTLVLYSVGAALVWRWRYRRKR